MHNCHQCLLLKDSVKYKIVKVQSLSKVVAQAGIASRRQSTLLIKNGMVTVDGVIVYDPGYKVDSQASVAFKGVPIEHTTKRYLVLNKPKGYITTTCDEKGRRTVMDLLRDVCTERLYPVGRLDRNTTGLLLFTNDGDLAHGLSHPAYEIVKVYKVTVNAAVKMADMMALKNGITLEDGMIKVDDIRYGLYTYEIIVTLHSGKYRIVRRMFEALGYDIKKLDRIQYACIHKKNVPVGRWRHLEAAEIAQLYSLITVPLSTKK